MPEYPDTWHTARQLRLAAIRQRVRELHDLVMLMDPWQPEQMHLFNRLHCSIWQMASGDELPAVRQLFRTMPASTAEQQEAISRRIYELRERFVKPVLMKACGDMPEAAVIDLFSQSRKDPVYV